MRFIRRLVPQQITVRARIEKGLITCFLLLSDGKCHRAIRITLFDGYYKIADALIRKITILAALQHKSPKSQFISVVATGKNFLLRQPVAICLRITPADSAVQAVILTIICNLNQPTDKHLLAVHRVRNLACGHSQVLKAILILRCQQKFQFLAADILLLSDLINDLM